MGNGCFHKKFIFFMIFILIFSFCFIPIADAGIKLLPAKLTIDISEFSDDEINYDKISVENPYDHEILVKTEVKNPINSSLTDGYSYIPDLSWFKIVPESKVIPANSREFFTIKLDIPDDKKGSSYNEKWEILACVFEKPNNKEGSVSFNIKLATKVFIHTPQKTSEESSDNILLFSLFLSSIIVIALIALIIRRTSLKRPASYYFKKKKDKK